MAGENPNKIKLYSVPYLTLWVHKGGVFYMIKYYKKRKGGLYLWLQKS